MVIRFSGQGKKCGLCDCYFGTDIDLAGHMTTHSKWRPARNGGEWMLSEADPYTVKLIRNNGGFVKDGYRIMLAHDGKIIFRVKEQL